MIITTDSFFIITLICVPFFALVITYFLTPSVVQSKAQSYAIKMHRKTRHKYDGKPYSVHLKMVVEVAKKFIHLIPAEHRQVVIDACWCHDVIEDCRETYNDVAKATSIQVAEIVYALTNEKGKTRKERASDKYYKGIRDTEFAVFVKMCDRIANYKYSKKKGSRMVAMYEKEMENFIVKIYDEKYEEMFDYLREISSK